MRKIRYKYTPWFLSWFLRLRLRLRYTSKAGTIKTLSEIHSLKIENMLNEIDAKVERLKQFLNNHSKPVG